ncbi:MAG: thioesterase family protein [Pseudomonadota bacterium]|nr:thioesterase family protein [Pseudomonadota bacterium]
MNLYLRLLVVLLKTLFSAKRDLLEPSRITFRVAPLDCDLNLHMNNGRYLTLMDLGRIHLLGQTRMLGPMLRARWMPVLGAAEINFIRPLGPLQAFSLVTRLVTWDEKYFYIEQRFESRGRICAVALVKGLFVANKHRVDSGTVLRKFGLDMDAPHMPEVVRHWNDLSALKRKHYG